MTIVASCSTSYFSKCLGVIVLPNYFVAKQTPYDLKFEWAQLNHVFLKIKFFFSRRLGVKFLPLVITTCFSFIEDAITAGMNEG